MESPRLGETVLFQKGKRSVSYIIGLSFQCLKCIMGAFSGSFERAQGRVSYHIHCRI